MKELEESRLVYKRLREIAARLTCDLELQKDLVQEMYVHLLRVREERPANTLSWYLRSGEYHARNWLRQGRSIDSHKRIHSRVALDGENDEDGFSLEQQLAARSALPSNPLQNEVIANEACDLIAARLSETQQRIVSLLMQDYGVREIAAKLGISHPAVIKHRKRIAEISREVLNESDSDVRPMPLSRRFWATGGTTGTTAEGL